MEHSKNPLPEEMAHIESDDDSLDEPDNLDNSNDDDQENQQVDLDNPMLHVIDDEFEEDTGFRGSQVGGDATQGLTPVHHQNIDESRIDELLVEDHLDDRNYPDIVNIADRDAAKSSNDND